MTIATPPARPNHHARQCPRAAGGVLGDLSAALVVLAVVPLSLLQVPDLISMAGPASLPSAPSVSRYGAELVRAAGLALPAMLVAAPVAAVAARRGHAWRLLMAGLVTLGAADIGASLPGAWIETLPGIAMDRAVHGLGAGVALVASVALIWERARGPRQVLACVWSAAAVAARGTFAPNRARRAANIVLPGRRARRARVGAPPSG